MLRITGRQFWMLFAAVVVLRFVVGLHFFHEGATKIRSGNFTAAPFLRAATGPFAPLARQLLDDPDGRWRLSIREVRDEEGNVTRSVDTELTEALWDDFIDRADSYYGFGDPELQTRLVRRRLELAHQIQAAREARDPQVNTRDLEAQRRADELAIQRLRTQSKDARKLLRDHIDELRQWAAANEQEIIAWWNSRDREQGFARDGSARAAVAMEVESLRGQTDKIIGERNQKMAEWSAELDAMWDGLESEINALAVADQAKKPPLEIHRPFAQPNSALQWTNRIVPWFDLIVGALLVLGLFTRIASLAGAIFLASIVLLQPPWIPDAASTWPQLIEFAAMLTLFAVGAGRFGGLDFFLAALRRRKPANDRTATVIETVA